MKGALPPDLIERIRQLYDDPRRGYHAWSHPQALLELLAEVRERLDDPVAIECAILLHDAVYDPHRQDNERRSAALARALLADAVEPATLARTVRLIAATERHEVAADAAGGEAEDMRVFLDMDLSVLAAPADTFDAYEAGVRHEYAHVPEPAFRRGRAAILAGFLARDRLFLSDWGRDRFEARARLNLQRSLQRLSSP